MLQSNETFIKKQHTKNGVQDLGKDLYYPENHASGKHWK
jgi:hypothetical protein